MSLGIRRSTKVEVKAVREKLSAKGIAGPIQDEIVDALPRVALAVILYGSQARGDANVSSDIDLLVVSEGHAPTRAVGVVNVSTYDRYKFETARGTLFGMHVARDGVVLHDAGGFEALLCGFGPVDMQLLLHRLSTLASLLTLPESVLRSHLEGVTRHARYVLRTAIYARAINEGKPCFSVAELASRYGDDDLKVLLSSNPSVQGSATWEVLCDLTSRISEIIEFDPRQHASLEDLMVAEAGSELADAAVLVLSRETDGPYTEIPRVIL